MGPHRGGTAPAPRRHPPRERQLGPSGRRTQQEPFAGRSREKSQIIPWIWDDRFQHPVP